MLPSDDCDSCTPAYLKRRLATSIPSTTTIFSYLPFVLTFVVVAAVVSKKLLPALSSPRGQYKQEHASTNGSLGKPLLGRLSWVKWTARRAAAVACAITIALSAVLVELILCEVSDTINPTARGNALRATLIALLLLIILFVPALEIHSTLACIYRGKEDGHGSRPRFRPVQLGLTTLILSAWLVSFWYLPYAPLLPTNLSRRSAVKGQTSIFLQACLKRIGIIGIALMATLAGFAAISSIWQTLGVRKRIVRETDIARKETGLSSVQGMLETKQSRLRALDRRMSQQPSPTQGFLARVAGTIKGDSDTTEKRALEMEISGLEAMASSLESSLAGLRSSYEAQKRSTTSLGRVMNGASLIFAIYCLYRTATISLSTTRRVFHLSASSSTTDPISSLLALLTTHYDASLDHAAWSRQISFAMSGVILLLSFSAVLQTFRLFSRFMPSLVSRAHTSLPLIISQIAGTYVISSALLLRSNLPPEVSGVIAEALGSPLDAAFAEAWFEGWFLVAAAATAVGVLLSKRFGGGEWEDWDDAGDLEMGKMS